MSFANRLKVARLNKGLTQQEVGKFIDKTDATVQRYENGAIKTIKTDILEKLSILLEVSPSYLMGWEDTKFDDKISLLYKNNKNKSVIEDLLKITDINFKSNLNWIFNKTFSEDEQKQILLDFNDILLNNKILIEQIESATREWRLNFKEYLELNSRINNDKDEKDIKASFYRDFISDYLEEYSNFISSTPLRLAYSVKDINLEEYIRNTLVDKDLTVAAHRKNGDQSDVKDIDGLKDLIREIMNEEK